jgi:phosphatidylcholine synthase
MMSDEPHPNSPVTRGYAFAVHVLTASGAAFALLALIAATAEDWAFMFGLLGGALVVDAIDGPLARRFKVAELLPRWSGEVLDLVIDFTTYVFVPAYAVAAAGLMPEAWSILAGIAIAITGALYFSDRNMKTADNYFRGFPAVWNLIAFYLLLLRPAPWIAGVVVSLFAVLTFVPVRFVHPLRVRRLRPVTIALLLLWSVLAVAAVWQGLAPAPWINVALCLIAVYFVVAGLLPARGDDT